MLIFSPKISDYFSITRILTRYQLLLKELLPTVWTREKYGVLRTVGKEKGNITSYRSINPAPFFFQMVSFFPFSED